MRIPAFGFEADRLGTITCMESTFTFLRVRGIPIGANWSWLLIAGLVTWSLGTALFPRTYPGLAGPTYIGMGIVTAVLFFGSIVLHELGHAFRALREGMRIDGITLWLFGGVARFRGMFPSPGAEFRIAVAGPAVSVLLALIFGLLAWIGARASFPDAVRGVVDYLARINGILVAFNLVPALPLDGGRVLRAWLWHRQGSFSAATRSAARAGRAFGWVLIAIGILGFFSEASVGGIWFVFLGMFLLQAAGAEVTAAAVTRALGGLTVADLMTPRPVVVEESTDVEQFLDVVVRTRGHSTYPVVRDGSVSGLVSLRQAGVVEPPDRPGTSVRDIMRPIAQVPVLEPGTPAVEAIDVLRDPPGRALVMQEGELLGLVSVSDVGRALELEEIRGVREERARPAGRAVWVVVAIALVAAASFLYHPPLVVLEPGAAFDVASDITVEGAPVTAVNGRYLLVAVRLDQPSAAGAALAALRPDREVVPLSNVIPQGDPEEFAEEQRALFRESRRLAAAAAAEASGLDVEVRGSGVTVRDVLRGSPASRVLRENDVIMAVDGVPVRTAPDLAPILRSRPEGTSFRLTIERRGVQRTVDVQSTRLERVGDAAVGIGVFITTRDLDVTLPFQIRFRDRDVGGPSAGLAYALAIADVLQTADIADGRTIAATGTIDVGGRVGAVGGVDAKAEAARAAGADVFLVPEPEVSEAGDHDVAVRGVTTLADALSVLGAN